MKFRIPVLNRTISFQELPAKKLSTDQLVKEISSSLSTQFSKYAQYYENPDDLVGKKGLAIYSEMREGDEQVKAVIKLKKYALISSGWSVQPFDEKNPEDIERADFIRQELNNLKGTIENSILQILTALDFGYSVTEKVYKIIEKGQYAGKIGLNKLKTRQPFNFNFDLDEFDNLKEDGLLQQKGFYGNILRLPVEKFIIYSHDSEFDNPYGNSDLRNIFRAWLAKKIVFKAWMIYLERAGIPIAVATHPEGLEDEDLNRIDAILKNIQFKSTIRKGESIKIEFLESSRSGIEFSNALEKYDLMIARGIMCPDLMGFSTTAVRGSYSLGRKQFDVFMWVLGKLAKEIEENIIGEQLIKPLIDYNWEVEGYPKFKLGSLSEDNTANRASAITALVGAGLVNENESWIREYLNLPAVPEGIILGKKEAVPYPPNQSFISFRELTSHEKKIDFKALKSKFNDTEQEAFEKLKTLTKLEIDDLIDVIKKKEILEKKDAKAVEKLQIENLGAFKNRLFDLLELGYEQGSADAQDLIGKASMAKTGVDWKLKPKKALDILEQKAFTLAGIHKDNVLKEVKMNLYKSLESGKSNKDAVEDLKNALKDYLDEELTPARLMTTIRTNYNDAYNLGAYNDYLEMKTEVPALQVSAIMDDSTTETCRRADGLIFLTDSEWALKFRAPLHFNCRTILIPIMMDEEYELSSDDELQSAYELIPEDFKK